MDRQKLLLLLGLAFMMGWCLSSTFKDSEVSMVPSAMAGDIYSYQGTSKDFTILTSSQDGRTIIAWTFEGMSPSDPAPTLSGTKAFTAR